MGSFRVAVFRGAAVGAGTFGGAIDGAALLS
jgi:hypothetical protein